MEQEIPEELFDRFLDYLEKNLGLRYTPSTIEDVKDKMALMAKDFGYEDIQAWIEYIIDAPVSHENTTKLSKHLSIGETYFFRDAQYFDTLKKQVILPLLQTSNDEIKVWSAGCSTGEEPYSVAILIDMNRLDQDKKITIIGTDINLSFLEQARSGHYRDWSFRGVSQKVKTDYFILGENGYRLRKDIRENVTFAYLNLIDGYYPSVLNNINNFDLILCNNVFIYFSPAQIEKVVERMVDSLNVGGYLCVTPIEAPFVHHPELEEVDIGNNFFFRKKAANEPTFKPLPEIYEFAENPLKFPEEEAKSTKDSNPLYDTSEYDKLIKLLSNTNSSGQQQDLEEMLLLIRTYFDTGKFQPAKVLCEEALIKYDRSAILHYLYGIILEELKMGDQAISEFRKCLNIDANFVIANYRLGSALLRNSQPLEAKKYLNNTINLLKNYPKEAIVPEGAGLTVGRLLELIEKGI